MKRQKSAPSDGSPACASLASSSANVEFGMRTVICSVLCLKILRSLTLPSSYVGQRGEAAISSDGTRNTLMLHDATIAIHSSIYRLPPPRFHNFVLQQSHERQPGAVQRVRKLVSSHGIDVPASEGTQLVPWDR